jgi:phage terminase large subunit
MQIKTNIVYKHLLQSDKKIIIEQGGTRSGKTYNILLWIIFNYCANNSNKIITICRKSYPALRATVMRDFLDILQAVDMYSEANHNKTNSEYRLDSNLIEFVSLDQPQKLRGRKRHLCFFNEINEISKEEWNQILFRTEEKVIGDFNPSDSFHFIYDDIIPRDDCDFFQTSYLDNPFLEESIKTEIERLKETDEEYWRIYGLGERALSKSLIFNYIEVDKIPLEAQFIGRGVDYGYVNDVTAHVSVYKKDHSLYIKEHLYKTLMTAEDIHNHFKQLNIGKDIIYADSAEPRLNDFLRRSGWNIRPSIKGHNSINAGIDLLKRYKLHITKDSNNAIQEFRNYKWKKDKSGKLTNIPVDAHNHICDALRYITSAILSRPNFGKYTIQ